MEKDKYYFEETLIDYELISTYGGNFTYRDLEAYGKYDTEKQTIDKVTFIETIFEQGESPKREEVEIYENSYEYQELLKILKTKTIINN